MVISDIYQAFMPYAKTLPRVLIASYIVLGLAMQAEASVSVSGSHFYFSSGTYYPSNYYYYNNHNKKRHNKKHHNQQHQQHHKKPSAKEDQQNRPNYNIGNSSMTNSPTINHNKNPSSCVKTIKRNGRTYQQAIPCTEVKKNGQKERS